MNAEAVVDAADKDAEAVVDAEDKDAEAVNAEAVVDAEDEGAEAVNGHCDKRRVGHSVLLRSERYDLLRSKKRTLRSFPFFSLVFGDL